MARCNLVETDRRFGGNYCHILLRYKRREYVLQNQTTRRHVPKVRKFSSQCRKYLKSRVIATIFYHTNGGLVLQNQTTRRHIPKVRKFCSHRKYFEISC